MFSAVLAPVLASTTLAFEAVASVKVLAPATPMSAAVAKPAIARIIVPAIFARRGGNGLSGRSISRPPGFGSTGMDACGPAVLPGPLVSVRRETTRGLNPLSTSNLYRHGGLAASPGVCLIIAGR